MTNTQSPAPGVATEVEPMIRVVEKATCYAVHRGNEVIGSFAGPDCGEHAQLFATALQASAAAEPVGVLCISHHLESPGMENIEYQPMRTLPPGDHLLFLSAENPKSQAISTTCENEPVYFIRPGGPRNEHDSRWSEATKEAYDLTPEKWRRLLYTAPPLPAQVQEADVSEAEIVAATVTAESASNHVFIPISAMRKVLEQFLASRTPAPGMAGGVDEYQRTAKWGRVYDAASHLMAAIGYHGERSTRDSEVLRLNECLKDLDGGVHMPGLTPSPVVFPAPHPSPEPQAAGAEPGMTDEELTLFRATLEGFADCGETETDYEILVDWAKRGFLECTNFQPTAAGHRIAAVEAGRAGS